MRYEITTVDGGPALRLTVERGWLTDPARVFPVTVDPTNNHMYVSDGYGNRRVVILDAATGKYIGHFGAYGNNPIDDKAAAAAGAWMNDFTKGNLKPAFFRNPVHCVKISKEGLI